MKNVVLVDGSRKSKWIDCFNCPRAWRDGEGRGFFFERADDEPLDLDYAQNLWDGCFRAAVLKAALSGSTTDAPIA
jgi:hypothetical protein